MPADLWAYSNTPIYYANTANYVTNLTWNTTGTATWMPTYAYVTPATNHVINAYYWADRQVSTRRVTTLGGLIVGQRWMARISGVPDEYLNPRIETALAQMRDEAVRLAYAPAVTPRRGPVDWQWRVYRRGGVAHAVQAEGRGRWTGYGLALSACGLVLSRRRGYVWDMDGPATFAARNCRNCEAVTAKRAEREYIYVHYGTVKVHVEVELRDQAADRASGLVATGTAILDGRAMGGLALQGLQWHYAHDPLADFRLTARVVSIEEEITDRALNYAQHHNFVFNQEGRVFPAAVEAIRNNRIAQAIQAENQRQQAEVRERTERQRIIAAAADQRATDLLRDLLTAEQWDSLQRRGYFDIISLTRAGVGYRLRPMRRIGLLRQRRADERTGIILLPGREFTWEEESSSLCIHSSSGGYAANDELALLVMLCRHNEELLWQTANLHRVAA